MAELKIPEQCKHKIKMDPDFFKKFPGDNPTCIVNRAGGTIDYTDTSHPAYKEYRKKKDELRNKKLEEKSENKAKREEKRAERIALQAERKLKREAREKRKLIQAEADKEKAKTV